MWSVHVYITEIFADRQDPGLTEYDCVDVGAFAIGRVILGKGLRGNCSYGSALPNATKRALIFESS